MTHDLTTASDMMIGGQSVASQARFGVVNPATGKVFAEAPDCSREQLDMAMNAAEKAAASWRADENARRVAIRQAADTLLADQQDLAAVLSAEQGKPFKAACYEVAETARWMKAATDLELPRTVVQDDATAYADIRHRPLGVVAAITPWNFPLLLAGWKLGPALLAGNTVVLKPSPFTPLSTLRLGELLASVLPPGVVNVVSGGDELGAWMTSHPAVRKISFTGSVPTGKAVAAAAAPDLKRITLELGGNDAAIVLDDADPAAVERGLFWGAFINNGQICAGIKRIYVPEKLHDGIVEALAQRARSVRVGAGTEEGVQLGPIQNRPQFERVQGLVKEALAGGARAAAGGKAMDRPGYFFEPTILTGAAEGTRIVDEEQFGPAVPVIPYRDVDDAIERANNTKYGLSGSVWSPDIERAAEVASRLHSGTGFVNDHLALGPHLPFGGTKWSGVGVENGSWGLEEFTELQVIYRSRK
ncbi:aldehyde dehydrogenase family protein [Streptomyces lydicus]|uniref:aldehyde dehydrogenase family protein n=1 Tax=Streptomyces lydicus TaxID=47763 RepID=UPI003433EC5E